MVWFLSPDSFDEVQDERDLPDSADPEVFDSEFDLGQIDQLRSPLCDITKTEDSTLIVPGKFQEQIPIASWMSGDSIIEDEDLLDHFVEEENDIPLISDDHGITYGSPEADMSYWHLQNSDDTCAIVCQEFIIESFLDRDIPESELVDFAIENEYYTPGLGTYFDDIGLIIEGYGIDTETCYDNSVDDLLEILSNDQKIIVTVDSSEIWSNSPEEQLKDILGYPEADHAVQVIGYDVDTETVLLNDPGTPDGNGLEIPRDQFSQAWEDSSNFMCYTTLSAPTENLS